MKNTHLTSTKAITVHLSVLRASLIQRRYGLSAMVRVLQLGLCYPLNRVLEIPLDLKGVLAVGRGEDSALVDSRSH